MAGKYDDLARSILENVGGAENVTSVTNCMTRLRFNLKDRSVTNDAEVKKIKGVVGCQWSGGQYQVIIGQDVSDVCAELVKLGVPSDAVVKEEAPAAPAKPPIKVCDDEDGMPFHHVKRFQTMAAMTPERIIGKVMNWE